MKKILGRFLAAIGRFFVRLFNIGIPLKVVLILILLVGGGSFWMTRSKMLEKVGGKEDYDEAMRYIEIKDAVQEHYIDEADRSRMGQSAASAMIAGLGDKWSYFMTPDEYKSYKLSSANEYSGIGMSISKEENGYFRVISVNPGSAAAEAGVSAGMILTDVDGESIRNLSEDQARTLIRSKLNGVFTLGVSGGSALEVDCTRTHESAVNYRKEKTDAGYVQIYNFEAGSADEAIAAIEKLLDQNIVALCIDLRGNAGGLADETQKLLDYLLRRRSCLTTCCPRARSSTPPTARATKRRPVRTACASSFPWSSSSTARPTPRPRSSPPACRNTSGPRSSAKRPPAAPATRRPSSSPTAAPSACPRRAISPPTAWISAPRAASCRT